jgi:endonuclease-3 related protein
MELAAEPPATPPGVTLLQYYSTLSREFGPQRWWPARTRLEIILGAILTQNTNWNNAALALKNLRKAGRLRWEALREASLAELERHLRPAGFYRQKARSIRNFVLWLSDRHGGSLNALFALPPGELRRQLMELKGLGPETADAIILYAADQPFFVADAYSRRVLARHGLLPSRASYAEAQAFLHRHLPPKASLFNEFHALLVEAGKRYCRRQAPKCEGCPLAPFLPRAAAPPEGKRLGHSTEASPALQEETA